MDVGQYGNAQPRRARQLMTMPHNSVCNREPKARLDDNGLDAGAGTGYENTGGARYKRYGTA
jgi:hypothetical protein